MKQRTRIYYSEAQKALMWERWKQGWTLHQIAHLFDRAHMAPFDASSSQNRLLPTGATRARSPSCADADRTRGNITLGGRRPVDTFQRLRTAWACCHRPSAVRSDATAVKRSIEPAEADQRSLGLVRAASQVLQTSREQTEPWRRS